MTIEPRFIHLKAHSAYSLAEGAIKASQLIDLCVQNGMPAIGLTDSGNLFGALEFALTCREKGVQAIIGCKLPFKPAGQGVGQGSLFNLTLLAQSKRGYHNLMKLASDAYLKSDEAEAPCLELSSLNQLNEGLILLSGALDGPIHQALLQGQEGEAKAHVDHFKSLFQDRFYIEVTRLGTASERQIETPLCDLAYAQNIPLVATNEVYFATPDMHEAHDILMCIAGSVTVSAEDRRRISDQHFFKSAGQMEALFADLPEAIENTHIIARRCHFMPEVEKPILPPYVAESGRNESEELRHKTQEGLEKRLETQVFRAGDPTQGQAEVRKAYQDRLSYEISVIEAMGFCGYFLIVSDFIQWAKRHGIPVGPGRGSGAGSLVAWVLEITDIDPIQFQLIFERFLNPERVSMPDFDIDFCQDRRDEVIDYVREKYGHDRVAHIITFGKLQARAVLRDVGRVREMPYGQVDKICKLIPNNPANPVSLEQAVAMDAQLRLMMREDKDVKKLIEIGLKLEGLYRHASTHAAGVVIGDRPLDELVPLYRDSRSSIPATQFNMKYVEQAGLMKFDFLGLKTLTVIRKACQLIEQSTGHALDISTIPLTDKKTFALLNRVETVGVFQLESGGMRDVLRRLKPDRLEELIALVALYRPGPMDDIPRYLACKHGEEAVVYLHPMLEPILKESFGVMVVQEQVMQIAQVMGGYTLGGADLLRRAMGKKNRDEMNAQRARFVEGAQARGVTLAIADAVFDQMNKFAGYGFNKSHAAPYALLTYQTAFLKANYPVEFLCASMTLDMGNIDKINMYRQELKRYQIPLLGPDVNHSFADFAIEILPSGEKAIRYGLGAIKNVGHQAMQAMVKDRDAKGPFQDIFDFAKRLDNKVMNKRQLENLILAGAFDAIHANRHALWRSMDVILQSGRASVLRGPQLFAEDVFAVDAVLDTSRDWGPLERLQREFDALGFYLTAHPLESYPLKDMGIVSSSMLHDAVSRGAATLKVAGIMISAKERSSKNGQRYAFVQMSDAAGQYEVVVFSEVLMQSRDLLQAGQAFLMTVSGRIDGEDLRLTVQSLELLEQKMGSQPIELEVRVVEKIGWLKDYLETVPQGQAVIHLKLPLEGGLVKLTLAQKYQLSLEQRAYLMSF